MLFDKTRSFIGKLLCSLLIITTQNLVLSVAYADSRFDQAVIDGNKFSAQMADQASVPTINANGEVMLNGEVLMTGKQLTGQQDTDYIPAETDTFGNDAATIMAGQNAQATYESKTLETASSSAEKAYLMVKNSFSTQKPDLTNDPMWENTDNIFDNIEDISNDIANCVVEKTKISTGQTFHVPKYETCEKLPAVSESFVIGHSYDVGILRHNDGPLNLNSCGSGCIRMWIGTVGDNYWSGYCTIYEENMSVEVIQPKKITYAKLERSKFDDYHQVYLNNTLIYSGPNGEFPPEIGTKCELATSWDLEPNVDVTNEFRSVKANGIINLKTRTSVADHGEGYSSLLVYYNVDDLVYNDVWTTQENIDKAIQVKKQISDGFCTGSVTCSSMPDLDSNGCTTINGIQVCESNFASNPVAELGLSPFCQTIKVESDCSFNTGELCWENIDGETYCFDNTTQDTDTCEEYEANTSCSYIKSACVDGATGPSGACYVQEDTYDCGFDATTGTEVEDEALICDGVLQCVGESCYSAAKDSANGDFAQVNAYLEMIKYAQADMTCEGVPEAPYEADSPPDQYYPVYGCPDGYTYNTDSGTCLQETTCSYSDNDFYSVDQRDGIQLLLNSTIIAENESVMTCIPVEANGITYTCGDAQLSRGTNTFYDVCANNTAEATENTCPDSYHTLNPNDGLCEVPPSASCDETKYTLVEGTDAYSKTDDVCESIRIPSTTTCEDGYTLIGSTCSKSKTPTITCPSGGSYSSSTGKCVYNATTSASCPSGYSRSGNQCVKTYNECRYDANNSWAIYQGVNSLKWDGIVKLSGKNNSNANDWALANGYSKGQFMEYYKYGSNDKYIFNGFEICGPVTSTSTPTCPSGYSWNGSTCTKSSTYSPTLTCSSGFSYNSSTGLCEAFTDSYKACAADMVLTADETECVYNPETMVPEYSCPSAYPNWNEEEGRCESESLNPLAAVQNERSFYQKNKYIIDTLLDPVGNILTGMIPAANADTTSSMTEYVSTGFSATSTTANTGDENVTCSLFKGEAEECKIAVGGVQNCCKAPVTPNLGDYIKLMTTMIQVDSMTAKLEMIDGYSGVWNTASDWASATASDAWETVSSPWASAADTAASGTAAGDAATEGATSGIMDQVTQGIMSYTNDFLTDQFGEKTASMFFQTTTEGTIAPSAQMAQLGQAMMYVYYAYLAYVVFTLLVNILYECTDDEMSLAMKRELLSTHYIGSYCKSNVLGVCIEKRQSYCVFDSPLSRIMMEQIYKQSQMGLSWGSAKSPNCTGLDINDVSKVDWDQVDLDEWIGILIQSDAYTTSTTIDVESLTGTGSILNTSTTETRDNVIESNVSRAENVDADEIRNDAYKDAWNSLQ
jgi:hypothetical protein